MKHVKPILTMWLQIVGFIAAICATVAALALPAVLGIAAGGAWTVVGIVGSCLMFTLVIAISAHFDEDM